MSNSLVIKNIGEIFTAVPACSVLEDGPYLIASDENGIITYVGPENSFYKNSNSKEGSTVKTVDAGGRVVYPGLIDSHTHIVFASGREKEFAMKAEGASYEEIAAAGGGILNSAAMTRNADEEKMYRSSRKRLLQLMGYGVTTVEIKSGYALDIQGELKMLRVINRLAKEFPIEIVPTFLGAHAVPETFRGKKDSYVDYVIKDMLPAVKESNLAEFVDVFCEKGYFSRKQTERIFNEALNLGFGLKLHADEFNSLGATEMAAEMGAVSVDHLEKITEKGMKKLAEYGTVGTVLPMTSVFSRLPFAPAAEMIEKGVTVALATDFNPGSSMSGFLPLAASLGATQLGMSVRDALSAVTLNAAKALRREKKKGSVEKGKHADIIIMDAESWIYPVYHFAHNHVSRVFIKGVEITSDVRTLGEAVQ